MVSANADRRDSIDTTTQQRDRGRRKLKEGQDEKSINMSQLFLAQLALQVALISSASIWRLAVPCA